MEYNGNVEDLIQQLSIKKAAFGGFDRASTYSALREVVLLFQKKLEDAEEEIKQKEEENRVMRLELRGLAGKRAEFEQQVKLLAQSVQHLNNSKVQIVREAEQRAEEIIRAAEAETQEIRQKAQEMLKDSQEKQQQMVAARQSLSSSIMRLQEALNGLSDEFAGSDGATVEPESIHE